MIDNLLGPVGEGFSLEYQPCVLNLRHYPKRFCTVVNEGNFIEAGVVLLDQRKSISIALLDNSHRDIVAALLNAVLNPTPTS